MKRYRIVLLALAVSFLTAASIRQASAQRIAGKPYQNNGTYRQAQAQVAPPAQGQFEELPPGSADTEGPFRDDVIENGLIGDGHYPGAFHGEGYGGEDCYDPSYGCGDGCSGDSCNSTSGCHNGRFFFTADYIYARAHYSEATAFVDADDQGTTTDSEYVPLTFGYESSYRIGGGYRLCECGDEIRFMYTRLSSDASDEAEPGDIVPYEAAPPPGGITEINGDVELKSYDLEFAKTIPLGGQTCCECGDACGGQCGDPCGQSCPAWDVTWSGGFRFAEADWDRSYVAFNDQDFAVTDARADLNFQGGGVRMGLEGRRYFFHDGWLSVYMKGDISLLLGDVEVESSRSTDDPNTMLSPDTLDTQSFETRQIVPVTEIEAGLSTQVTCNALFTAGYLFSAWHDLGFRDDPEIITLFQPPTHYDDANILGFDGFFARFEYAF
jgi:hypothetical protein